MAMTLKDIRQKYPDYDDLSDVELADKLHSKFYADLPKEEVYKKLDLPTEAKEIDSQGASKPMELTLTKGSEDKGADWRGLAGDTIHMLGRALKNGVGFLGRAPGNIKEVGSELLEHPLSYPPHVAQQVLAGLGEGAKGIANIPHEIFDELADKKITPNWLRTGSIPEDTGVEKFLGLEPTKKSDELLRALPALYGGGKLVGAGINKVKPHFKAPDLQESIRTTQSKVNALTEKSGKIFDHIEDTLEKEGKNVISVDKDLIEKAKSMLSNKFNNIIEQAKTGDYKALRKLQSSLGAKERKGLASKNLGDIDQAENIGVVRDAINETIQKHLETNGFEDLAKALNKNRNDYAQIQKTYFSTPQLAKVFGKSQKVPKNPKTLLTEESVEMKRFMSNHPEVKEALTKALKHDKKMKRLKSVGSVLGIGTTAEVAREILGGK